MNLPNKLTVLRICLVPVFVLCMLAEWIPHRYVFALLVFAVASYTDHLDGKIARSRGIITNFGKLLDPLADKILVMSALICFVKLNWASTVCVIIIMFREFAVTSIRLVAVEQGRVIAANKWGKIKTVSQIIAVLFILAAQAADQLFPLPPVMATVLPIAGHILIWISTFFTLLSGIIYAKGAGDLFQDR